MRAHGNQTRVNYPGTSDDFLIFVESAKVVRAWRQDHKIPLKDVVNGWSVFTTNK
jgi:hypothetical protein